jgi:hypothetical protein
MIAIVIPMVVLIVFPIRWLYDAAGQVGESHTQQQEQYQSLHGRVLF